MDKLAQIIESVIDPKQPKLSKYVFDDQQKLLLPVRSQILRVWSTINSITQTGELLIVGSIATYNYSEDSDVDVTIQTLGASEEELNKARALAVENNGKYLAGPHEVNYFIKPDIDFNHYDSVYNILGNRWIKGPAEASVDVSKYVGGFMKVVDNIDLDKAELLRDLADYKRLTEFNPEDLTLAQTLAGQKLSEIESDLDKLTSTYKDISNARRAAFLATDLERLREYGRINALPENVIYLLLRRYCYLNFLSEIKRISKGGLEPEELPRIGNAYKDFTACRLRENFDSILDEELADFGPLPDDDEYGEPDVRQESSESTAIWANRNNAYFAKLTHPDWKEIAKELGVGTLDPMSFPALRVPSNDKLGYTDYTKSIYHTPMFSGIQNDKYLGWHLSYGTGRDQNDRPAYYAVILRNDGWRAVKLLNDNEWRQLAEGIDFPGPLPDDDEFTAEPVYCRIQCTYFYPKIYDQFRTWRDIKRSDKWPHADDISPPMIRDNVVNLVYDKLERAGADFDSIQGETIDKHFSYGDMTHPPDHIKDIPADYNGEGVRYHCYADSNWAESLEYKVFKFGSQPALYMLVYEVLIN